VSETTTSRTAEIVEEVKSLLTGDRPLIDSAIPPLVYVAANAIWGLTPAVVVAIAVAAGLALYRITKDRPVLYALGGVAGVGFAAGLAALSGDADTYFLPGIISNAVYASVAIVSVVVKRPLNGWASWLFRRWPLEWYWRDDVRPAYTEVTWLWGANFAAKSYVSYLLYQNGETGWLGVSKVAFGWPTILPLLIVTYLYGNWRLHNLGGPNVAEFIAGKEPPFEGKQKGF
jgi:hypothetical protein